MHISAYACTNQSRKSHRTFQLQCLHIPKIVLSTPNMLPTQLDVHMQIIDAKWPDDKLDDYANMKYGNLLKCRFAFYWQTVFSEDGGPLAVKELKVIEEHTHQHTHACYGLHEGTRLSVELQQDIVEIGCQHHMQVTFSKVHGSPATYDNPEPYAAGWGMTLAFA